MFNFQVIHYPLLSQKIKLTEYSVRSSRTVNFIYSIARSISHPINYPGDSKGKPGIACGVSWVSVEDLKSVLKTKFKGIKRTLNLGVQLGFWRRWEQGNGYIKFSLRSPHKIASFLGLDDPGSYADITPEDFDNLNVFETEMIALAEQEKTYYAARAKIKGKQKMLRPDSLGKIREDKLTSLDAGKPVCLSNRYVGVNGMFIMPYGVSLKHIAKLSGKSIATVQKHLSCRFRQDTGLPMIRKVQLAVLDPELTPEEVTLLSGEGELDANRFFFANNKVLKKGPCIYIDEQGWRPRRNRKQNSSEIVKRSEQVKNVLPTKEYTCSVELTETENFGNHSPSVLDGENRQRETELVAHVIKRHEKAQGIKHPTAKRQKNKLQTNSQAKRNLNVIQSSRSSKANDSFRNSKAESKTTAA